MSTSLLAVSLELIETVRAKVVSCPKICTPLLFIKPFSGVQILDMFFCTFSSKIHVSHSPFTDHLIEKNRFVELLTAVLFKLACTSLVHK